jgi:hypothetical protein
VTRTWRMYAGRPDRIVDGREFMNFGTESYVRMYGREPVEVKLTEDPDGRYWGWIRAARTGLFPRTHTGIPEMIQPHEGLFQVQFPYGPEESSRAGEGEIVRMSCRAVD